jgi:hypothetical protein
MESAKRGSSIDSAAKPEGQRRRPQPPVLDLTATELAAASSTTSDPSAAAEPSLGGEPGAPVRDPATPPDQAAATPEAAPTTELPATESHGAPATTAAASRDDHFDRTPPGDSSPAAATADSPYARAAAEPQSVQRKSPPARRAATITLATVAGAAAGSLAALGIAWMIHRGADRDSRAAADAARLGRLETQMREFSARPVPPQNAANELVARVAAAEEALKNVAGLQARLAQAEATLRSPPPAVDPEVGKRIAGLDAATQQLDQGLGELRRRLDEISVNAQAARDTAIRSAGSSTEATANVSSEVDGLTKRVQTLETTAQTLQTAVTRAPAPQPDNTARLASAALALRMAVERGGPFAPELAAMQTLARDPAKLAPLQAFAADGVPTTDVLTRELSALLAELSRGAETTPAGDGGVLDRVQQAASKLVRVRPADGSAQAAPGDALAHLKTAAGRGDLGAALAEVGKLPETQRAAFAPWAARAQARTAALEVARGLSREAVGAFSATEPVRR